MANRILTTSEKWAVIARYCYYYDPNEKKLPHGAMKMLEKDVGLLKTTIHYIIKPYFEAIERGEFYPNIDPKSKNAGRPSELTEKD